MHHFVGADNSCISWGHAQNGELGYGPNGQKSSAVPKKVDILEGMHVIGVACGTGHSMVIVDRTNVGDGLDQVTSLELVFLGLQAKCSFCAISFKKAGFLFMV